MAQNPIQSRQHPDQVRLENQIISTETQIARLADLIDKNGDPTGSLGSQMHKHKKQCADLLKQKHLLDRELKCLYTREEMLATAKLVVKVATELIDTVYGDLPDAAERYAKIVDNLDTATQRAIEENT